MVFQVAMATMSHTATAFPVGLGGRYGSNTWSLRAVPYRMGVVSRCVTDGTHVAPQDRTSHYTVRVL